VLIVNGKVFCGAMACLLLATGVRAETAAGTERATRLERGFRTPPETARAWCYWWWLNGCVTRDGIVRDLDHMKRQGIGGALVFHAGEGETPFRLKFMSKEWRALFKFAVEEAAKRGIVIGLNLCAGWNAGGPWVKPEEAVQTLGFKVERVRGGKSVNLAIAAPKPAKMDDLAAKLRRDPGLAADVTTAEDHRYYRDIATLAWSVTGDSKAGTSVCCKDTFVDLTDRIQGDQLAWQAPAGDWAIVRFGHFVGARGHTKCTGGNVYLEIDPLRPDTMDRHFAATAGVLIDAVKPHVGKTFQFVHIDSGEVGKPDWTPALREEFRKRRGYDPLPYLAARAGLVVDGRDVTVRFNEDFERTLGDLMVENYYGRLAVLARRQGLGTHSEAAGFQKPCVDALASLGCNDLSMSEFWDRRSDTDNYIHQLTEELARNHDGIKTAAAAAHIYGRRIVQAEAFTVMRNKTSFPNWIRAPFDIKDLGDRAFCAGLNRIVFHGFVHQPEEASKPGYKWPTIGNEFDRHVTWAPLSYGWLTYLARCQHLLQAGDFAADVCYFQGEWVPSFIPARWAMNPALPAGFDCDTVNAEILTGHARVDAEGRLALDSGMTYRYLVLNQGGRWRTTRWMTQFLGLKQPAKAKAEETPADTSPKPLAVSPELLARIKALVEAGLTLIGPPPARAIGLSDYPDSDREVARLADEIWGPRPAAAGERRVGKGRVIWGKGLDEVFKADNLSPDLEITEDAASRALPSATRNGLPNPSGSFDWIHRRIDGAEVYFIANLRSALAAGDFTFRVGKRRPELWDPVTGGIRDLPEFTATRDARTCLPLRFEPRQSFFVVFRFTDNRKERAVAARPENFPQLKMVAEIAGAWDVSFDPRWGGPAHVTFDRLLDWSKCGEEGVRHYSGTATYKKSFDLPSAIAARQAAVYLDLGEVNNLARVKLNSKDMGVVWTAPWRVEITDAVRTKGNQLEIDVVNLWPNRLIGDAALPPGKRFTRTNVTGIRADWPLFPSGLLGPVRIVSNSFLPQ
jgi:hypothetical protein